MQAGGSSHPRSVRFLPGDLRKGVLSAWSGARVASWRGLAAKVRAGLKSSTSHV